ncbi:MAG: phenylalanine--tRNA ligase subunit alpha [Patescibacteria group bacterium]
MDIATIRENAKKDIQNAKDAKAFDAVRVKYLGRKDGALTNILKSLKDMSLEEKRKVGVEANALKLELEELIEKKEKELAGKGGKRLDVTKPGKKVALGHLHPLTKIDKEIRDIFSSINFTIVDGPELEDEYHNFDALNIPADHPARDMWDTFWVKPTTDNGEKIKTSEKNGKLLMRTHTSPMQIRYMETHKPPFQIIVPGRTFRYEATDASHEINFYQVEGLMVGPDITLANFKFVIETFFKKFFDKELEFRYRPSYFPFVEPGVELDIKLPGGKWLEVMGAGMVHRNVFDAVKYDRREVQGFAFGMGLDRLAMIKYGIPDIRLFYSGDVRFTEQF